MIHTARSSPIRSVIDCGNVRRHPHKVGPNYSYSSAGLKSPSEHVAWRWQPCYGDPARKLNFTARGEGRDARSQIHPKIFSARSSPRSYTHACMHSYVDSLSNYYFALRLPKTYAYGSGTNQRKIGHFLTLPHNAFSHTSSVGRNANLNPLSLFTRSLPLHTYLPFQRKSPRQELKLLNYAEV